MKVSLNQLVHLLSDFAKQPFSVPVQEELKVIMNYKRADWMQKVVEKYPEQRRYFLKDIAIDLIEVDQAECPVETDCTVKRTSKKIPLPLRSTYALFDYVGDPDKSDGYGYIQPEYVNIILKYAKHTSKRPKYFYTNGYIYIYNDPSLVYLGIRGVWPDQTQLNAFKCSDSPCYTDDDQWDIPDDIINTMIQDVLRNEMRILIPGFNPEVTVDDKDK